MTNYDPDKPSYGFSTATTEFDDALIKRGIVTFEQAMIAKGASPKEAQRLAKLRENGPDFQTELKQPNRNDSSNIRSRLDDGHDINDVSDTSSSDDDEQFIQKYRQKRISEMKKERISRTKKPHKYGEVLLISRPAWTSEVNEASKDGLWVVVNLTRRSSSLSKRHDEICDSVEEITRELAAQYKHVKFVSISSTSAIENWPAENLPTLFCYRYGKLQHQLIGIGAFGGPGVNSGRVEWRLAKLGVIETELEEDPKPDHYDKVIRTGVEVSHPYASNMRSQFGGVMSQLATTRDCGDSDYDDID